jgi:hypothetical protein
MKRKTPHPRNLPEILLPEQLAVNRDLRQLLWPPQCCLTPQALVERRHVTLAYLKGKDAESEEAQEHANSSRLALYA